MPDPDDRVASTLTGIRERYRVSFTTLPGYSATLSGAEWTHVNSADDIPLLLTALEAALALHTRQDKPVHCWDHVCDAHRDQFGFPVQPPPRDCPDCRFRDMYVCKHCQCPNDEWPCPTYLAITAALTGKEAGES
jgi:hypothetical protein